MAQAQEAFAADSEVICFSASAKASFRMPHLA
jgi:hypothetical protein